LMKQAGVRSATSVVHAQATLEMLSDDLEQAARHFREAVAVEEHEGFATIFLQRSLAECLTRAGRLVEADAVLEDALKRSEETGELWNRSELIAKRAVLAARRGDLEAAERYVRQAQATAVPDDASAIVER